MTGTTSVLHKFNHDKTKTSLYRHFPIFLSTRSTKSPLLPRWPSLCSLFVSLHAAITSLAGLREHQAGTRDPARPDPTGWRSGSRLRSGSESEDAGSGKGPAVGVAGKGQSQRARVGVPGEVRGHRQSSELGWKRGLGKKVEVGTKVRAWDPGPGSETGAGVRG